MHLSAVGVVLCIELVGRRQSQGLVVGWVQKVGEGVGVSGARPDLTDPVRRWEIIGINGISCCAGGNIKC